MATKPWYEALFENYAEKYDEESFAQGTIGECDFIEQELAFDKQLKILDVGCGTGRHSIELAKRGYDLTGIDLSGSMLEKAKKKAEQNGVRVGFLQHDARNLQFKRAFDAAIMLCEGGFPLMETDEMNYEILRNVCASLKDHGTFIFTTLNGLYPLFHSLNDFYNGIEKEDNASYKSHHFDLMTLRDYNTTKFTDDNGIEREVERNER